MFRMCFGSFWFCIARVCLVRGRPDPKGRYNVRLRLIISVHYALFGSPAAAWQVVLLLFGHVY